MENFVIVFVVLVVVIIAGLIASVFLLRNEQQGTLTCLENNGYLCAEDNCPGDFISASLAN